MSWPDDKITLETVSQKIKEFNFIIYTTTGVYDTSLYNLYKYNNSQESGDADTHTNAYSSLTLAYNSKDANKRPPETGSVLTDTVKGDRIVKVFQNSVQKITVKSKRDFLLNQAPFKS